MRRLVLSVLVACSLWRPPGRLCAFEADQYTVPASVPADISAEIDRRLIDVLRQIMWQLNHEVAFHERQAATTAFAPDRRAHRREIEQRLDADELRLRFYEQQAPGWPETPFEDWMRRRHRFAAQPAFFQITYEQSIYADTAWQRPLLTVGVAPVINLHGVLQTTDKIGHFLQQGYQYDAIYRRAMRNGRSEEEAVAAAVKYGVFLENGPYGRSPTGIYSNADLAANFAGFRFFQNLASPVTLDGRTRPALCIVENNRWRFAPNADFTDRPAADFLRCFITDHFDESLNPSSIVRSMRRVVGRQVEQRRDEWFAFHNTTPQALRARIERLTTWRGEDYGHGGFDGVVSLVELTDRPPPRRRQRTTSVGDDHRRAVR